jgi:hypothetical protein
MNNSQVNFAYKVRHALTENIEKLPPSTLDRLSSARKQALSRKKVAPLPTRVTQDVLAGNMGRGFSGPASWAGRMGLVIPVIVLVVGLMSIFEYEQQERISDLAEIDALVLSDELPLSAYLDHGFNAYLAKQVE